MNRERTEQIYRKTDGYCHLCAKKLSLNNYAKMGSKGAWEIEHSVPKAKGGSDHLNNLFPACINCNRDKGIYSSRTARRWHDQTKAPLSKERKQEESFNSTVGWFLFGIGALGLVKLLAKRR